MKKFTNLLIVCSLALAGAVMAQAPSPEESKSPGKKADKKAPAEVKPKAPQAPKTEAPAVAPKTQAPAVKEPAANEPPPRPKVDKKAPDVPKPASGATRETKTDKPAISATPDAKKQQSQQRSSDTMKSPAASAKTSPSVSPAATKTTTPATPATKTTASATPASAKATATPATAAASATPAAKATATPAAATTASATPAAATTASATPAAATTASATPATAQTSPAATVNPDAPKKPEPSKIQQIRERHANFRAQPRVDVAPAVTFTPNYRIQGAEQWQGPQYEVYRTYRPERRDRSYYQSRYQRVELIAGGYYYFHNNYWYPAWGYSPREEYYAYDAPIYVGKRAEPLDKVIAEVQAVLQEMGYYKGEVDGLIGPLTREALIGYQNDYGLTRTAVIDEPTLNSLGLG